MEGAVPEWLSVFLREQAFRRTRKWDDIERSRVDSWLDAQQPDPVGDAYNRRTNMVGLTLGVVVFFGLLIFAFIVH